MNGYPAILTMNRESARSVSHLIGIGRERIRNRRATPRQCSHARYFAGTEKITMTEDLTRKGPSEDQASNEETEEKTANKEDKKETKQVSKSNAQNEIVAPAKFIILLNTYLLFVTAVGGIGVVSYYATHLLILQYFFYFGLVLVIAAPLAVVLYLLVFLWKRRTQRDRPTARSFLERLTSRFPVRFFDNSRSKWLVILFGYSICFWTIADVIRHWPRSPRLGLTVIVIEAFAFFIFTLLLALFLVLRWISEDSRSASDLNKELREINDEYVKKTRASDTEYFESLINRLRDSLSRHSETLDSHSSTLNRHSELFRVIGDVLKQQEKFSDIHLQTADAIQQIGSIAGEMAVAIEKPKELAGPEPEVKPEDGPNDC
jgi:ABC-type transport system involved in cytochrome bd biosynthesis fused ATPase/permease subunit